MTDNNSAARLGDCGTGQNLDVGTLCLRVSRPLTVRIYYFPYLIKVSIGATRVNLNGSILPVDESRNANDSWLETNVPERRVNDSGTEDGMPAERIWLRCVLVKAYLHIDFGG